MAAAVPKLQFLEQPLFYAHFIAVFMDKSTNFSISRAFPAPRIIFTHFFNYKIADEGDTLPFTAY
jgi:hypothetical protein